MTATDQPTPRPRRRWNPWFAIAFVLQAAFFAFAIVSQIQDINTTRRVRATFLASPDTRRDSLVTFMSQKIVQETNELYVWIGVAAAFSAGTLAGTFLLGRRK